MMNYIKNELILDVGAILAGYGLGKLIFNVLGVTL